MCQDRAHDLLLLTSGSDPSPIYNSPPNNAEEAGNVTVCKPRLVKRNRRAFGQAVLDLFL